jgi:hypothetical protein
MSTDFEQDVSAALHRVADEILPPSPDLDAIRRGGRRRRMAAFAATAVAVAVLAAGAAVGVMRVPSAPAQLRAGPAASASQPSPTSSRTAAPAPSQTGTPTPASTQAGETPAMANVQAFYSGYQAAAGHDQPEVLKLISIHMASWYTPILAHAQAGYPPGCFAGAEDEDLAYASAGTVGGQAIIVVSSSDAAGQVLYAVVSADPGTGKITSVACTISGSAITAADASNIESITSWDYQRYLTLRRQGASPQGAVAQMYSNGGIESGPYLGELQPAAVWQELTYDPLLCISGGGLPDVSATGVTVVAGGSAALVVLTPSVGQSIVAVSALGAQGWAIFGVACHQP